MDSCNLEILTKGVNTMKTDEEMLSSILKTTQMGQSGIRSILNSTKNPEFRKALNAQLKEYDSIEDEAHKIAAEYGWELPELSGGVRVMSDTMTRMKMMVAKSDSNIAGMMIQGNTKGMITGLKNRHHWSGGDEKIGQLSQKLLSTEDANIQQMKPYL